MCIPGGVSSDGMTVTCVEISDIVEAMEGAASQPHKGKGTVKAGRKRKAGKYIDTYTHSFNTHCVYLLSSLGV
jgi:hypothetical protein